MSESDTSAVIETRSLVKSFGNFKAVDEVDYQADATAIDGIIGPNGAGKTTFLNLISGRLDATSGQIFWKGEEINDRAEHERSELGIARTFQIIQLFEELTGYQNVLMAGLRTEEKQFRLLSNRTEFDAVNAHVEEHISLLDLEPERLKEPVENLSHLERRKIDLVMALLREPDLLLLDEPFAGLEQESIDEMKAIIQSLVGQRSMNVIIVDHNLPNVIELVDRLTVLHEGRVLAQGTPEEVTTDEAVQQSYIRGG